MNTFEKYLTIWDLTPDGEALKTQSSSLLPVRYKNSPAMLKIATVSEERSGGWLAIDPKGLLGERGFDFANLFCNPDIDIALQPGRLEHQTTIIADMAKLDRSRLIKWIIAYAGLSAAWHVEDGTDPKVALAVAKIALSALHA